MSACCSLTDPGGSDGALIEYCAGAGEALVAGPHQSRPRRRRDNGLRACTLAPRPTARLRTMRLQRCGGGHADRRGVRRRRRTSSGRSIARDARGSCRPGRSRSCRPIHVRPPSDRRDRGSPPGRTPTSTRTSRSRSRRCSTRSRRRATTTTSATWAARSACRPRRLARDGAAAPAHHRRPWRADVLQPDQHPRRAAGGAVRRAAGRGVQSVRRRGGPRGKGTRPSGLARLARSCRRSSSCASARR